MQEEGPQALQHSPSPDTVMAKAAVREINQEFRCWCKRHKVQASSINQMRWLIQMGIISKATVRKMGARRIYWERINPQKDKKEHVVSQMSVELDYSIRSIHSALQGKLYERDESIKLLKSL